MSELWSDLWSWASQHLVLSVVIVVVGLLLLFGSLIPIPKRSQIDPVTGRPPIRPLSRWSIYAFLAAGVGVTVGTFEFLLAGIGMATLPAADQAQLWMDAVKTALTAGIGAGGLLALYVSFRRQMVSERDHLLQSQVAANNQHDATEKRVTELYGRAVDQLANDSAAVRFGGLYALERLAQANPEHRQTIVDLICGYLRIGRNIQEDGDSAAEAAAQSARGGDEGEVRATAQKILKAHLQPDDTKRFWSGTRLDLHGARLEDFSLYYCEVGDVDFRNAQFVDKGDFAGVDFKGRAEFKGAIFRGPATFGAAKFKLGDFEKTEFCDRAEFENAKFDYADFSDSIFRKEFVAIKAIFDSVLDARDSEFFGPTYFRGAQFGIAAQLDNSIFHDFVQFLSVKSDEKIGMNASVLHAYVDFGEDLDFDLARATIKKDAAEHLFPPGDWYVKTDVDGDFAVFRAPYMDERDQRRDDKGSLKAAKAAENGSAKAEDKDNAEVAQMTADRAAHVAEDESTTSGQSS